MKTPSISYKDFDVYNLSINEKNQLLYNGQKFNLKLKNLYSHFGIQDYNNDKKYFVSSLVNDELKSFLDKLTFRVFRLHTDKILFFHSLYKPSKDPKYLPTMKFKFKKDNMNKKLINVELFDTNKNYLSGSGYNIPYDRLIQEFNNKTKFSVTLEPYLYKYEDKYGITFFVKQLRILGHKKTRYCDLSSDDENDVERVKSTKYVDEEEEEKDEYKEEIIETI